MWWLWYHNNKNVKIQEDDFFYNFWLSVIVSLIMLLFIVMFIPIILWLCA